MDEQQPHHTPVIDPLASNLPQHDGLPLVVGNPPPQHKRGPLLSLEVDEGGGVPIMSTAATGSSGRQRPVTTPAYAKLRYILMATLAMILGLTCPGTYLYRANSSSTTTTSFQWWLLLKATAAYVTTLLLLCSLNGSNPGYLKDLGEVLEELEDETLLDHTANSSELLNQPRGDSLDPNGISSSSTPYMNHRRSSSHDNAVPAALGTETSMNTTSDDADTYQSTRRRYCPACRVSPPLRSHHCKQCNQCVATFDHHCDFVGTCIGERNHTRFWWFLLAQALGFSILCHMVGSSPVGLTTLLFSSEHQAAAAASHHTAVTFSSWGALRVVGAKFYLYPLRFCAWAMVVIHTWMAVSSSTTFELSKGTRHIEYLIGTNLSDLPFSKGLVGNLRFFCCQRDDLCNGGAVCLPCIKACPSTTEWRPTIWQPPGKVDRDSEDWWEHPWQNKYWSCC